MCDYSKGKIYKIFSPNNPDYYIGSTTKELKHRLKHHYIDLKSYQAGYLNYRSSFKILDYNNVKIELVEDYPCNNKFELERREGEIIRLHKFKGGNINIVNVNIPRRTKEEIKTDKKRKNKNKN